MRYFLKVFGSCFLLFIILFLSVNVPFTKAMCRFYGSGAECSGKNNSCSKSGACTLDCGNCPPPNQYSGSCPLGIVYCGDQPADCSCGGGCPYPVGSYPNACDFSNYYSRTYNPNNGYCSASCNGTCQYFDQGSCSWQTSTTTCNIVPSSTIKGYKVQMPNNVFNSSSPNTSATDTLSISADYSNSSANPYSLSVNSSCISQSNPTGSASHTVLAPIPAGYSAGYSQCDSSDPSCVFGPPNDPNLGNAITGAGNNYAGSGTIFGVANVTTPAQNSSVDIWWHYCSSANWVDTSACILGGGATCGNGVKSQRDSCGNIQNNVSCQVTCSFFQTYGGDVTFKQVLSNTQLPNSSYFISNK